MLKNLGHSVLKSPFFLNTFSKIYPFAIKFIPSSIKMYLCNMVMSKSHCQLACFIVRQFSFFDKNCKYILHLKLLPYYGSRGNSKLIYTTVTLC